MGSEQRYVEKAFEQGLKILKDLNLTAYSPNDNSGKAEIGFLKQNALDFLGCTLTIDKVRPNRKSCRRFLQNLDKIVNTGMNDIDNKKNYVSYLSILNDIHNITRGWEILTFFVVIEC